MTWLATTISDIGRMMGLLLLTLVLLCGCSAQPESSSEVESSPVVDTTIPSDEEEGTTVYESGSVLGEGTTHIYLTVTDYVAQELVGTFEIYTDQTNLGDALTELQLISVDGSTIEEVNGVTATTNTWVVYVNGDPVTTTIQEIAVEQEMSYMLQLE